MNRILLIAFGASLFLVAFGQGNNNNADEKTLRRCSLKQTVGPCRAKMPRWSFDRTRNECVQFFYGGCRGNRNRFKSLAACERKCKDKFPRCPVFRLTAPPKGCEWKFEIQPPKYCPSPVLDCPFKRKCSLKKDSGPCLAFFPRYYFDRTTQSCKKFTYGGCQGNDNRFLTLEECQKTCAGQFGFEP